MPSQAPSKYQIGLVGVTEEMVRATDSAPANKSRSSMVQSLLEAYGLAGELEGRRRGKRSGAGQEEDGSAIEMIRVRPEKVTRSMLTRFHREDYVRLLMKRRPHLEEEEEEEKETENTRIEKGIRGTKRTLDELEEAVFGAVGANMDDKHEEEEDDSVGSGGSSLSGSGEDATSESELSDDTSTYSTDSARAILSKYGLLYDCPLFAGLPQYVRVVVASTMDSCKWLVRNDTANTKQKSEGPAALPPARQVVAVNWLGGRHHGRKARASGFCYVNDIVLGIQYLRQHYARVVYVDLDLHYGDGVAEAFRHSDKVMTVSVHHQDADMLFFPFCGAAEDGGSTVSVPVAGKLTNGGLAKVLRERVVPLVRAFLADGRGGGAMVVQCGTDGLFNDDFRKWSLTVDGMASSVVEHLVGVGVPVVLLGGGGYRNTNTARFWSYLVAKLRWVSLGGTAEDPDGWGEMPVERFAEEYAADGHMFFGVGGALRRDLRRRGREEGEKRQTTLK